MRTRCIARRLADAVFCVFLFAGLAKLWDLDYFAASLASWTLLPQWLIWRLTILVPSFELGIALVGFLGLHRTAAVILCAAFLTAAALLLAIQIRLGQPPQCGCFGPIDAYYSGLRSAEAAVIRNVGLLGLLAASGLLSWRSKETRLLPATTAPGKSESSRTAVPGFTLIELLVVLVVLAVLVAVLLPTLSGSRRRGQEGVSLSNLRSHAAVFAAYTSDWRDEFPFFMDPTDPEGVTRLECRGRPIDVDPYFAGSFAWNFALGDAYYDGNYDLAAFHHPALKRPHPWWSSYWYPCAFVAAPQYWNPRTRTGPEQLVPTRQAHVRWPSKKLLLVSMLPYLLAEAGTVVSRSESTQFAFVDGSAAVLRLNRIHDGYPNGDGDMSSGAIHVIDHPVGLHTIDGASGQDVR